jgi:osmotically-inducible protein OsmY
MSVGTEQGGTRSRQEDRGRWRVRDVMTADVVTAEKEMSYKQVATLMAEQKVVSRRDLLCVFLRPDDDIVAEVDGVLADILLADPGRVTTSVRDGIVILSGTLSSEDLVTAATRLACDVDGVVSVDSHLKVEPAPASAGQQGSG